MLKKITQKIQNNVKTRKSNIKLFLEVFYNPMKKGKKECKSKPVHPLIDVVF